MTPTSAPSFASRHTMYMAVWEWIGSALKRIADVIAEMSVDIVALQELDLGRRRSAGVDQTKMIAERLGWYGYFHPAMRRDDERYGNAVLSRYQFTFRRALELPSRPPFFCPGESRGD